MAWDFGAAYIFWGVELRVQDRCMSRSASQLPRILASNNEKHLHPSCSRQSYGSHPKLTVATIWLAVRELYIQGGNPIVFDTHKLQ